MQWYGKGREIAYRVIREYKIKTKEVQKNQTIHNIVLKIYDKNLI